jgi:hypothetical protein
MNAPPTHFSTQHPRDLDQLRPQHPARHLSPRRGGEPASTATGALKRTRRIEAGPQRLLHAYRCVPPAAQDSRVAEIAHPRRR